MFVKYIDLFNTIKIDLMILDEAHTIKGNINNKSNTALRSCKCKRRILLTGTPVQNNLIELC